MKNAHLFLLISFGLVFSSFGVNPIPVSVKDILQSVEKDRRIASLLPIDNLEKLVDNRLPILNDLGVRYGTDDLTDAKQQYAVRFGFNSFKMIKEQQSVDNSQFRLYQAKRAEILREITLERYLDIVDLHFAQNLIHTNRTLETLLNKKNTVLKTSLQKGISIKIKDLAETEEDLKELGHSVDRMNGILMTSQQKIKNYLGLREAFVLNIDNFITIEKLKETLSSIKKNKQLILPDLNVNEHQIQLAESELRLEEVTHKQIFDGVQLTYERKPKSETISQDFAFRVGFNVPLKSKLRAKQNKLLLELKEAENERQFVLYNTQKQIELLVFKIENLLQQYETNQATINSGFSYKLLNSPKILTTLSPTDIIDLKIIQHKKNSSLIKLEYELIKEYVELLDLTGYLIAAPNRNYLSNTLEQC
ncbi:MAG: hypothetical protein AB8G86_29595 [Saprospiraceae bacterium]